MHGHEYTPIYEMFGDFMVLFVGYVFIGFVYNAWAAARMAHDPLPNPQIWFLWPAWVVVELGYGLYRIVSFLRANRERET